MIRSFHTYFIMCVLLLQASNMRAQNMTFNGRFTTRHFSVDDFGSAGQIWAGAQGADGNVYFGNRQDLLSFNGVEWHKIGVSGKQFNQKQLATVQESGVLEIFRASDNILYVGRKNSFGYLSYNDSGKVCYFPLKIGSSKNKLGDFWNIYELNEQKILFISDNQLYISKNKKISRIQLPASFSGYETRTSCRIGNGILVLYKEQRVGEDLNYRRKKKFLYIDLFTGKPREINVPEHIQIGNIRGSFQLNNDWYVFDVKGDNSYRARFENGKFIWNGKNESVFPEMHGIDRNNVTRKGNHIWVGTENQGLLIFDLKGHLVRKFDYYDGLPNLYVFKNFQDQEGNIWLCLDNGIQFIETSNPVSYFNKEDGISSIVEAIDFGGGAMLTGLHSDIFEPTVSDTRKRFITTDAFREQIFDVRTVSTSHGKRTLVIGYNGIYEYDLLQKKRETISRSYAFALCPDKNNPDIIYVTLESGIARMTLTALGKWKFEVLWENIGGETYSLSHFGERVYFGIKGEGLGYYDLKTGKKGIIKEKSNQKGRICSYNTVTFHDQLLVETKKGLAFLSEDLQSFNVLSQNDEFFGKSEKDFHRMININDEQLWLVVYRELGEGKFDILVGWMEKHGRDNWKWIKWPLAGLKKAGVVFSIAQGPDNEIWLGANNGLYVLNFDAVRKFNQQFSVSIHRFEVNGKAYRYHVEKAPPIDALSYAQNTFRVVFHANSFSGMENMEYRTKLEGFNDDWSEWSDQYYKDFQKIPEGTYTLKIQARNGFGIESSVLTYEITILPPWYRTIWAYVLYVVGLIFIIYLIVQLSIQRVKRQNQRLEAIVQERTSEIAEQNKQLEVQKAEITQKTTDILDSIQYAKRIQTTILPAESRLGELFHEHFVFYRPKDIVSGDFYWAREVQGKTIFASVDCTGHGVPGSLVSIVGNNGLLRAVNEFKLTEPNAILDRLREIVVNAFRSEGQLDVKDGMDIALCSIDYETGVLKYAGANNECVIIRGKEVFELKPDKQPIGQFVDAKPFTLKEFQLEDDDCIYLYTDGYVDQFGGEKIKKFKSRPFKTMLTELTHLSMQQQFEAVRHAFDNWKGDLEQVDDVCVFGVRYKKK